MGFRRCSRQVPESMENIPDDILPIIFIRLPSKQLAQMRCLSKYWNALLSESSFIKSHLDRSIQNNKNDGVFLVFPRVMSFASKPITACPSQSLHLELTDFIKFPVNIQSDDSRINVIGSVNGLICFIHGSNHSSVSLYSLIDDFAFIYGSNQEPEVIYIWNPSLSALLTLPSYNMPSHSIQQILRFGYDPKTDDHKVVKITRRLLTPRNDVVYMDWLPVEVYSMKKGSWKLITQTIPSHIQHLYNFDHLCVDGDVGHLHWGGYERRFSDMKSILAFDFGAETFSEIPLPESVTRDDTKDSLINVGIMDGKLFVTSKELPDYKFVVWVMGENGVAESWVKHHVGTAFGDDVYPDGFKSHLEFLLHIFHRVLGYDQALYDRVAAKIKFLMLDYNYYRFKVFEYVDSLVWVTNTYRAAVEELL